MLITYTYQWNQICCGNFVIGESINVVVSSGKGCAALIKGVRQDALFIANEKDVITCDGGEE